MKLAIVGAGYVGLVTAACFAEMGHEVTCVDADKAKVEALEQGRSSPSMSRGWKTTSGAIPKNTVSSSPRTWPPRCSSSLVVFIAVGTPQDRDGSADLSMVLQVARDIGRQMDGYKVIVEKSTVPVGTASMVRQVIQEDWRPGGRRWSSTWSPTRNF